MSGSVYDSQTFRLLKRRPTFVGGVASLLDISASRAKYNYDKSESAADVKSLRADWLAIGQDIQDAMNGYGIIGGSPQA
jgi:hypothetical protein